MPRRGLRLDTEENNLIVHHRRLAKKRKDHESRVRLRAILLIHAGKTLDQVGQILEVARSTIQRWIERFRRRGVIGLLVKGPYRGKHPGLSLDQKRELAILVRQGPEESGLDTGVWTAPIIADLVKRRFNIKYSASQIRRILHELGFSIQYPRQALSEADKKRQATWIEEELPEIKKRVQEDEGILMYQDEVSFKQSGSIYRHWILKGIGSEVKTPPKRDSLKVTGAVTVGNNPKFHFRFVNWFNTDNFLTFLNQLISRYPDRKIHLILDNAKYHKGPKVKEWLKGKEDRIELHYLPPYSPKFNAVEYIWKETRRKTTHNRFFKTLSKLKERLFRRFNRFQGNPASLRSVLASFA
jgi:putative transposase